MQHCEVTIAWTAQDFKTISVKCKRMTVTPATCNKPRSPPCVHLLLESPVQSVNVLPWKTIEFVSQCMQRTKTGGSKSKTA